MLWFVAYPHNSAHTLILSANKKKKDSSMFGPKIDLRAFHSLGVAYDHMHLRCDHKECLRSLATEVYVPSCQYLYITSY